MAFIGSILGAGQGSSYTAPQAGQPGGPSILNPTDPNQLNNAQNGVQGGLAQQQAFANAAMGQNGLQNQSDVYNQLQNVANGTGPNPAQAQLAQATGANVANQAALMAGQRGAGSNVGLIARQAAMQGAATQQQAVGQAASLQAQQSANALGQLGSLAGQQVGQQASAIQGVNQAQQSAQQNLLNANQGANSANAGIYGSQVTGNTNIQVQNSKAQQGIFGGLLGGAGSLLAGGGEVGVDGRQQYADGGMSAQPIMPAPIDISSSAPILGSKGPQSSVGKFLLYGSAPGQQSQGTPLQQPQMNALSSDNPIQAGTSQLVGKAIQAGKNYYQANTGVQGATNDYINAADANFSGQSPLMGNASQLPAANAPSVGAGMDLSANGAVDAASAAEGAAAGAEGAEAVEGGGSAAESLAALLAKGGKVPAKGNKVPAMVSPGEVYLDPREAKMAAQGKVDPIAAGKKIPGQAKVPGNSYANDTVPVTLEEGGIVIPRAVMESEHPHWEAMKFVRAIMAKQGLKK